jgi:DNA polymerase elongation subunit (family B)
MGGKKHDIFCHEQDASPLLQLIVSRNIPTAGWIYFEGLPTMEEDKISSLPDEYTVFYDHLFPVSVEKEISLGVPSPCVLSFDLEVYSSNPNRMPLADHPKDSIFQISCVFQNCESPLAYLITLGKPVPFDKTTKIIYCLDEKQLLLEFSQLIRIKNPHVIIGYNIFGFDIPYMVTRCKMFDILHKFDILGIPTFKHSKEKEISWSSSAYSYQEFHYLESEGRLFIDLLPVVKRDYKFSNYQLKTVSTFFLGETKDPLTHLDIFRAYEEGMTGSIIGAEKLAICGKYCVQDSALVLKLFNFLQLWIGLSEMAKICCVPIMFLFTKGQQIKVYSQLYKKCFYENILVQSIPSNSILESCKGYSGAYVFPPKPGIYEWVIPFDFSSLYPTTIIAYNIDYSTLVLDESTVNLSDCHVIEWEDHVNCEHDAQRSTSSKAKKLCSKNRFIFRKEPVGVIPSLLKNLLHQRAEVKKQMKLLKYNKDMDSDTLEKLLVVLDKRQLAYKLSGNSAYGFMGVQKGYLPFMPGAMSTTAMGRQSIQRAAEFVKSKHHGHLIYGDSVSKDTPIAIKTQNDHICVRTISDLFLEYSQNVQKYDQFKPYDTSLDCKERIDMMQDIAVMTAHGWKFICKIIRHKTIKKMYRIITNTGIIEVTEDHSLLDKDNKCLKPLECKIGSQLLTMSLKEFWKGDVRLELSSEIIKIIKLYQDGSIHVPRESSMSHIMTIYLYLSYQFSSIEIQCKETDIVFVISLDSEDKIRDGVIVSIEELGSVYDYVYDLETEDGSFHAGIGNLIVKNTDSIYCHFPKCITADSSWKMAKKVETDLLQLFPPPMKLVFEEKIYKKFLILTKKRYMAYTCNEDGSIDEKLTIRGVLLARRDNCKWIRVLYERIVRNIMDGFSRDDILNLINDYVLDFMQWKPIHLSSFIITKQVNKEYNVKNLPTDLKKCKKRLEDLQIFKHPSDMDIESANASLQQSVDTIPSWLQQYILKSKPAHVQLADRMTNRGKPVEAGSRIEFIIIQHIDDPKSKLFDKLEDPEYFKSHRDLLRLDRLYYLKSLAVPVDQLLSIVFKVNNFISNLYEQHLSKYKLNKEIHDRNRPIILFDDEVLSVKKKSRKKMTTKPKAIKTIYDYL